MAPNFSFKDECKILYLSVIKDQKIADIAEEMNVPADVIQKHLNEMIKRHLRENATKYKRISFFTYYADRELN